MDLILAILLFWNMPEAREDGEALYSNEIAYYEMYYNGEFYDQTTALQMDVQGYGDYQVRTVDVDGQVSEFSNTVTVSRVKGKPGAPGQLRKQK